MKMVVNLHSTGNAFIYPLNGVKENNLEEVRPGMLSIFETISKDAPFP